MYRHIATTHAVRAGQHRHGRLSQCIDELIRRSNDRRRRLSYFRVVHPPELCFLLR